MGGEITYTCIKSGSKAGYYVFNVIIYRDCQGIPIDTNTFINVHNHPTLQTIGLNYVETNDISPICDTINGSNMMYNCGGMNIGYGGNGIGAVEEHIYRSDTIRITGTPDNDGWHFTWSDCCRNGAIINIDNPNNYGFTLRTAMYPYTDTSGIVWPNNNNCYDNSPKFYEKPRTILETYNGFNPNSSFNGFTYSHNAFDEELDSISYEFAPPLDETSYDYLNPNSTSIPFSSGFDFNNPINQITLDPVSGRTSYPADMQGNYVTCTKVSSFRCGQLISEVFREIQVVLTSPICNLGDTTNGNIGADTLCNVRPSVVPPFYYPNQNPQYQWDTLIHCGDTVNFDFIANDYDFYPNGSQQDLLFEVSGGQFYDYENNQLCNNPPCATFTQIGTNSPPPFITSGGTGSGHFEWITDCSQLNNGCFSQGPSVFSFVIKVSDDFCPAPAIENTAQVITITVFPPCDNLKSNFTVYNSTCNLNDGKITVSPSGGFPPYLDYYSDLNGNSVNPDSLLAGDYILRIVDSTLCERVDTFTIVGPNVLVVNSNVNDVSCSGGNDGFIDLNSNSNLSYIWNNGDTSQSINSLSVGNYSVTYSDSFGCFSSQSFQINEPLPLSLVSFVDNISCNGFSDGQINVTVTGGLTPYAFSWSNGDTTNNIINLPVNLYDLLITDLNGCTLLDSFYVSEPQSLLSQITSVDVECYGDTDGMLLLNASGGTLPYSYLWNTGATTQDLYSISSGLYFVNIIDSNGCILLDSGFVNQPNELVPSLTIDTNGITGSVTGGVSPYVYDFYSPSGIYLTTSNSQGTDVTISTTTVGYYSLVITDANGCIDSVSVLYGNNFSPNVNVSLSNYICDSLSSLTIAVSQDSGQVDMSTALFQSNAGYFDISSLNVGDTIGTADLIAAGGNISVNTMLVVSTIISSNQVIITPCSWSSGCLGSFTITNIVGGGVEMISQSVPDGNNFTLGNSSTITFDNLFVNPCSTLIFTTTINSELGDVDNQTITYNINQNNFSPNVNVSLSNYICDSLSSLTIAVSQDSGQVDMSTALFQSNAGYFDISSLNVGDTIGTADLIAAGGNISVNTMLVVSTIISSNQVIITPCSWSSGCLGSFTITNIVGGGVEMISQSVPDGNNFTLGNSSTITFDNLFVNPCSTLIFTTTINSELGDVDNQTITYNITSIIESDIKNLLIYPNPNFGKFTLEFYNSNSENIVISIYNNLNSLILKERVFNFYGLYSKTFDLSNFSKGMYIIKVSLKNEDVLQKMILH